LKRELERIEILDAREAEARAWATVERAARERVPAERQHRRSLRPLLVVVAVAALAGAVASPPGRAVVDRVRRVVGVERAAPALFRLPTSGRLLAASDAGVWVVAADGSRRLLGSYREASWSPFGRYVVAARRNELAALNPDGTVRWSLARPDVRFPRWAGSATDTRIAYLTGSRLHVVAGDGTRDADAGGLPAAAPVAPSWRHGAGFVLAYADTRGRVFPYDTGNGSAFWTAPGRSAPLPAPRALAWSGDGQRLVVRTADKIAVFGSRSGTPLSVQSTRAVVDIAFRPGTHDLAVIRRPGDVSEVMLGDRVLFSFAGALRGLTWSPDGRWLLVGSPESDQWVFIRADGRKIIAVSNVSDQLHSRSFPRIEGWCCST
jgi:hypothetical protein